MIITYLGKEFFKIQQGDLVVAINPISKDSKEKVSRFGARMALSTMNHPDFNGFENVSHGDTVPFEISGPGDYEIQGIFIKGIQTTVQYDGEKYINTIYSFSVDNISICFLGALSEGKLPADVREQIDSPDIVFISVGGSGTMGASEAYKLAVSLDAKVIIPMEYDDKLLKAFLKEGGQESTKSIEKLTIKAKELLDKEGEIIVLES
jgi:L-ascorbate metabolism protein UlaG (beta-lactamase superfamily)